MQKNISEKICNLKPLENISEGFFVSTFKIKSSPITIIFSYVTSFYKLQKSLI